MESLFLRVRYSIVKSVFQRVIFEPTFIVFTVNVLVCSSRYKDKYKNVMKLKRKEFSGGFVRS